MVGWGVIGKNLGLSLLIQVVKVSVGFFKFFYLNFYPDRS